jgi:hypothetical protein
LLNVAIRSLPLPVLTSYSALLFSVHDSYNAVHGGVAQMVRAWDS